QPTSRRAARQTPTTPPVDGAEGAEATAPAGPRGFRKHPTAWLISAAALVFVLLGTGAVFAGATVGSGHAEAALAPTPSATIDPDYQAPTTVVDGSTPGTIVLVVHGDPTLSAGGPTVYNGAPHLSDLAAQTVANYAAKHPGVPITQVVLDAGYWNPADMW